MGGGLLQIAAYGSENQYIMGNPEITFFKTVFRRHTNFAMENIQQYFEGKSELSMNHESLFKITIGRNADLIHNMYLCFTLPAITSNSDLSFRWIKSIGTMSIKHIKLFIGGQLIETVTGEYLEIYHQLTVGSEKRDLYNKMTGNEIDLYYPEGNPLEGSYPVSYFEDTDISVSGDPNDYPGLLDINSTDNICDLLGASSIEANDCTCTCTGVSYGPNTVPSIFERHIYIPLPFWFCKNSGSSLPLIALQKHEVELEVEFRPINELYTIKETDINSFHYGKRVKPSTIRLDQSIQRFLSPNKLESFSGWGFNPYLDINYVFLDKDEREVFAKKNHEYLIEQVHKIEKKGIVGEHNLDLNLFHPVKEIIWTPKRNDIDARNEWLNFTNKEYEELNQWVNEPSSYVYTPTACQVVTTYENYKNMRDEIITSAQIKINNMDRTAENPYEYFTLVQPYQHHTDSGKQGIYLYSFSLEPDKQQPTGCCNMSRIKNVSLRIKTRIPPTIKHTRDPELCNTIFNKNDTQYLWNYDVDIYVINYNILKISSGMGGLVFAN